uniref:Transmembrane protein n=1 Tax=Plectus sambesii TaxID=2011161 RepID=A0A914URJ2_9BILA
MYVHQRVCAPSLPPYLGELHLDRSEIASISPSSTKSESTGSFLNFDRICTAKRGVWCPAPILVVTVLLALLSFIVSNASVYYLAIGSCAYLPNSHPDRRTNSTAQLLSADLDRWHTKLPVNLRPSTSTQQSTSGDLQSKDKYESKNGQQLIDLGSPNESNLFQLSSKPLSAAVNSAGKFFAHVEDPGRVHLNDLDTATTLVESSSTGSSLPTTTLRRSQIVNRIFDLPAVHSSATGSQDRPNGVFTISADIEPIASGNKQADTRFDLVNFVFYKRTESPSSPIKTTTTTTTPT